MAKIVAPCGRADAAETLLAAGADGLYVGLSGLSHGRRGAELSLAGLEAVCRTARARDAFVLLSLNLMPLVAEEPLWRSVVDEAAALGIDGVILQDPGLASDLRSSYPRLDIHASVGAAALNAADARFWREAGADVLVLQPGTAPEEAASIRHDGGIEVELFVSGRRCQATLLGQCGMGNYLRQTSKSFGWRKAIPEGSRKRSGVCYYVCEGTWEAAEGAIGPWGPVAIELEAPLAEYLAAGVTHLKLGGRDQPVGELADKIRAVRQAVNGKEERSRHHALSCDARS